MPTPNPAIEAEQSRIRLALSGYDWGRDFDEFCAALELNITPAGLPDFPTVTALAFWAMIESDELEWLREPRIVRLLRVDPAPQGA